MTTVSLSPLSSCTPHEPVRTTPCEERTTPSPPLCSPNDPFHKHKQTHTRQQALVHLAITHKPPLSSSSSSFDATAALTRLLEYAEQGLESLDKAGAALRRQQSPQQQAQQAAGRAFEQVPTCLYLSGRALV